MASTGNPRTAVAGARALLAGALLVVLGVSSWAGWNWYRSRLARTSADDPWGSFTSPYRNVRPGVKYVGDKVCGDCHVDHATAFHGHPMGRSFALAPVRDQLEAYDRAARNPFEVAGLKYFVEPHGDKVFHKESLAGKQGKPAFETSLPVRFALGSGAHGRAYLIDRDGFLFQSPISWYTQRHAWDLSPGYGGNNRHFERPITGECLFCHSNYAGPLPDTLNRYGEPMIAGLSVGCERCHGPGELHVARRERQEVVLGLDDTIVNPRHLDPPLREAVCQQCHLQGAARILRYGREPFDYRPGLPLHWFRSVFVRPEGLGDEKAVSQVEQMYSSKCFQASNGKLGCISCHNPHELPAADKREGFYRNRCLQCHEVQSPCSFPLAKRQAAKDNCISCHMPPTDAPDIAHTALTDHRIRRRPREGTAPARPPWEGLAHFHGDLVAPEDKTLSRDLGLALIEVARRINVPEAQQRLARDALPLLEDGLATASGDLSALEAKGHALRLRGHTRQALAVFETVLDDAPNREVSLQAAQTLAELLGQQLAALDYSKRLIAANPWNSQYHYHYARLLGGRLEWRECLKQCQLSLEINPADSEARKLLIRCYLRIGQKESALREFEILLLSSPEKEKRLREWLAQEDL